MLNYSFKIKLYRSDLNLMDFYVSLEDGGKEVIDPVNCSLLV